MEPSQAGELTGGAERSRGLEVACDPEGRLAILDVLDGLGEDAVCALRAVRGPDGSVVDFEIVAATRSMAWLFGVPSVVGSRLTETLPAEVAAVSFDLTRRVLETGKAVRQEMVVPPLPGSAQALSGEAVRVRSRGLVVVLWRDLTALHAARDELQARERRFRALVEHSDDMIVLARPDREIVYVSPAVQRIMSAMPADLVGLRWGDFSHADDRGQALDLFARVLAAAPGSTVTSCYRTTTRDGRLRWMDFRATNHLHEPAIAGVVLNVRDITEQREAEEALQQQALQDALTGLPNRRWFLDAARHAAGRSARGGGAFAVLLVDLDEFKVVNDSLGHPAGDRLLVELASRMLAALRPSDSVARLGGDEFVVLAEGLAEEADAVVVAERLREAASGLYDLGNGLRTRVSLSIGICTAAGDGDPDELLAHADVALYEAKRRGRGRVEVFDPVLREQVLQRLHTEHELHAALERDELVLHWQPIVDLTRAAVVAAEALVRWQHPDRGLLLPAAFLPVAEQSGLMPELCARVADRALAQAAAWEVLPGPPRVFVNLGAAELAMPGAPDQWHRAAARRGVDPSRVTVEVSERLLPGDVLTVRDTLGQMRARGFRIALDDFGAGNTALSWLQQLPLDLLKLDRRFTANLGDPATEAIVRSLVALAPLLGLDTLAEGVETVEQLTALEAIGCGFAQGYHLARPQPADRVTALLGG